MLSALMSGKALTATELAGVASVTKQTASAHLAKLLERNLLVQERQGRHRYFRLADDEVAQLLEGLMTLSHKVGVPRLQIGPTEPALRKARVCYDHLAGETGVSLFESLQRQRLLTVVGEGAELTVAGIERMQALGIDVDSLLRRRRPVCRVCLDWSERRHHLAGSLGAALLELCFERRWAARAKRSRAVMFNAAGINAMRRYFDVRVPH
jgi:Helix-turn-helix domain